MVRWIWRVVFAGDAAVLRDWLLAGVGRGDLGNQYSRGVGIRDCEFCVVDWNRPRGNAHLGHFAAAAPAMANFDQPIRGSDDDFRGVVRGAFSAAASGQAVAFLLAVSLLPELHGRVAAVPQPAGVGRVRGIDVL